MKRLAKWSGLTLVVLAMFFCALRFYAYRVGLTQQNQAARILVAVTKLQPGVTTVADLERDVFPVDHQFAKGCTDGDAYASVYNFSSWKFFNNELTPESVRRFEGKWLMPRWTMFSVALTCHEGMLTQMRVVEMQEVPDWPHPYTNASTFLSQGVDANRSAADRRPEQRSYWVYERGTSLYAGDRLIRQSPILNRFVYVTPDATAEEKRRALNFHLDCFTRWNGCQGVDLILQPAPNRS